MHLRKTPALKQISRMFWLADRLRVRQFAVPVPSKRLPWYWSTRAALRIKHDVRRHEITAASPRKVRRGGLRRISRSCRS
jgi:hypothetical protein